MDPARLAGRIGRAVSLLLFRRGVVLLTPLERTESLVALGRALEEDVPGRDYPSMASALGEIERAAAACGRHVVRLSHPEASVLFSAIERHGKAVDWTGLERRAMAMRHAYRKAGAAMQGTRRAFARRWRRAVERLPIDGSHAPDEIRPRAVRVGVDGWTIHYPGGATRGPDTLPWTLRALGIDPERDDRTIRCPGLAW